MTKRKEPPYIWLDFSLEPFVLDSTVKTKLDKCVKEQSSAIFTNLNSTRTRKLGKSNEKQIKDLTQTILTNLVYAHERNKKSIIKYSRNKNDYSGKNEYIPKEISHTYLIAIIDYLFAQKLILSDIAGTATGRASTIQITSSFYKKIKNSIRPQEQRYIKNPTTKQKAQTFVRVNKVIRQEYSYKQQKVLIEKETYTPKPKDQNTKRYLNAWNTELRKQNFYLDQHFIDIVLPDNVKLSFNPLNKYYYRLFADETLSQGGRFFRAWWQNIKSRYRHYITIDFQRTVELDFSNIQPKIAYFLAGHTPPNGDLYNIPTVPNAKDSSIRKTIKRYLIAMFYAERQFKENDEDVLPKGWTPKQMIDAIKEHHKPIAHLLLSPDKMGMRLQFLESQIVHYLNQRMKHNNISILSIHDSFITPEQHEKTLKNAMQELFSSILTSHDVIVPDSYQIDVFKKNDEYIDKLKTRNEYYDYNFNGDYSKIETDITLLDKPLTVKSQPNKEFSLFEERANQWLAMYNKANK